MASSDILLFDLDGTLADTLHDIGASANHVRALHGLPAASYDELRSFVGDGARTLLRRALAPVVPSANAAAEAFLDAAFGHYASHHQQQCTQTVRLFPGVREFLCKQQASGAKMAVVTNKPERFALPVIQHLGLAQLLPVVIGGDTALARKPDPAPLQLALERLGAAGATRGSATMIGDSVVDLRAGKLLGMRTIACLFGFSAPSALHAEGADEYWQQFGG